MKLSEKSLTDYKENLAYVLPLIGKKYEGNLKELDELLGVSSQTRRDFMKGKIIRHDLLERCYHILGMKDKYIGLVG